MMTTSALTCLQMNPGFIHLVIAPYGYVCQTPAGNDTSIVNLSWWPKQDLYQSLTFAQRLDS